MDHYLFLANIYCEQTNPYNHFIQYFNSGIVEDGFCCKKNHV